MASSLLFFLISALMQDVICELWSVTMPQRIMGVEGSCVSVPCSFRMPSTFEQQLKNCSGESALWKRGSMFTSKTRPGHLVGDLRQKNCSTVFQNFTKEENNTYFLRLECGSSIKFSFMDGVNITVSPGIRGGAPPQINLMSHVTEGGQVTLQCVAMVPCPFLPPSITWAAPQSRRQEQSQIMQSSDGQMMLKSILTFTASVQHHKQTISCSTSYPLSAGGSTEALTTSHLLNVLYGPRLTAAELSVSGPVSEGRLVIFSCSSDANPPVTAYSWFSNSNGTAVKVGEGRVLPLQVRQTHSGLYQCQAQNERGAQLSNSLVLDVHRHNEKGFDASAVLWISVVCAVLSALCIFTVALLCYKYKSLSVKLEHLEQKEEHIYCNLQTSTTNPDYDQLQPRPTTVKPPPEDLNYENAATLRESSNKKTQRT